MVATAQVQTTTFNTAIPYAVGTLSVGAMGAVICLTASGTAAIVMGVALALFGAYAFLGVIACGLANKGNPEGFEDEIGKFMLTAGSAAFVEIIEIVAKVVLIRLLTGDRR